MRFCKICESRMVRQLDGTWKCEKNNHIEEDETTKHIQVMRLQEEKERLERITTFPDVDKDDICVLRLKNPFEEMQKGGFRKDSGEGINTPSFPVYDELTMMEKEYSPSEFRRLKGNIHASGGKEAKYGWIICKREIYPLALERIESVILNDGSNFSLEEIHITKDQVKEKIKEEKNRLLNGIKDEVKN